MKAKKKYKITLNWYGEVHTIYTSSSTEQRALNNATTRLAATLGMSRAYVKCFFLGERDNFKIKER